MRGTGHDADSPALQISLLVGVIADYAIFLLDADGRVISWNAGAERIKGYTAEEIMGQPYAVFFTETDRERGRPDELLAAARRDGRHEDEGWRRRKDGSTFWADALITCIRGEQGELLGYGKVTRDLTARRAAEAALRASNAELARANRELDRFASVAAHDLREPLRTVSGFGELLARRYADALDDRGRDYVEHVRLAVERMEHLVESLLEYARSGTRGDHAVPVNVGEVLSLLLNDLRASIDERGANVRVDVPDDATVLATAHDLGAVLRNLVSNAVKFGGADGPRVTIRARRASDAWCVEVLDDGIGIDPADRPRIFAAFQRLQSSAEYPGTGLGLAIAQRVVERNGGAIGVESVVGEGSRFWFTLPAV